MPTITRRAGLIAIAGGAASAQAVRRPNILLLFPDQLRPDWVLTSMEVHTPNLEKLRKRGMNFTNAVVASPLCAPSRACLASGKEYDRCGAPGNGSDYPLEQTTYYKLLRESGYHVMGCGKLDLHKKSAFWGLDGKRLLPEWGFSDGIDNEGKMDAIASGAVEPNGPYMALLHKRGLAAAHVADMKTRQAYEGTFPTPLPDDAYCDNWIGQNGLDLLRRAPKEKPWHLAVNFTGPHNPMDITRSMETTVRGRKFPQPNGNTQFDAAKHVAIRENYTAMVENLDRWVGTFLDELEKRGELDNTFIVFSSDHGEMLGDHDRWAKSVPYQPSVAVPLLASGPGVKRNETTTALVSVMDLAATFLDYGGVARPSDMDSRSLRPVLEGKTKSHRDILLSGLGPWRMVWDGRHKLVRGFNPERTGGAGLLLFDHRNDPLENNNLAGSDAKRVKALMERMPKA